VGATEDVENGAPFEFPDGEPLTLNLKP